MTSVDAGVLQMTVPSVLSDAIEGNAAGASGVTRVQIGKIERREVDGVKTALRGAGIFVLFGLAVQSLGPYSD